MSRLEDLGWTADRQESFQALGLPADCVAGRVYRDTARTCFVLCEAGEVHARVPGAMRTSGSRPVVGDWVALSPAEATRPAVVRAILPRTSAFVRKVATEVTREQVLAANVDVVFLVAGLDGDFNLRRLERALTLAWNSGATPVLLLNKADLCDEVEDRLSAVRAVAPGVDVHALSAKRDQGLEVVTAHLTRGRTGVFFGSSGVGKSTLVNRLCGTERMETREVREHDDRGQHTTTHRELAEVPGGGLIIDTPGLREFRLWGDGEGVAEAFSDIEELATGCRFRNCGHDAEPGCAVRAAIDTGQLDQERLESYRKLQAEMEHLQRRQTQAGKIEARRKDRAFGKMIKNTLKHKPSRR